MVCTVNESEYKVARSQSLVFKKKLLCIQACCHKMVYILKSYILYFTSYWLYFLHSFCLESNIPFQTNTWFSIVFPSFIFQYHYDAVTTKEVHVSLLRLPFISWIPSIPHGILHLYQEADSKVNLHVINTFDFHMSFWSLCREIFFSGKAYSMLQLLGLLFTRTLYESVNTDKSSNVFATSFEVLAGNPSPPVFLYL